MNNLITVVITRTQLTGYCCQPVDVIVISGVNTAVSGFEQAYWYECQGKQLIELRSVAVWSFDL